MKICVWRTGHEIAAMVAVALDAAMKRSQKDDKDIQTIGWADTQHFSQGYFDLYDLHIGYGILRGMDEVFRACQKANKPFIHIDKGYWKPGHYNGYYRVSLNGTQQITGLDKLKPDYERWDALGIEIDEPVNNQNEFSLICPPTVYVANFFGITDEEDWKYGIVQDFVDADEKFFVRYKGDEHPIDYKNLKRLITFNSSVGWEALRQGIPVISDPTHSIIGAYVTQFSKDGDNSFASRIHKDVNMRRDLFALMAGLQLTLEEMRSGLLWPLIQTLLSSTSDTTAAKA